MVVVERACRDGVPSTYIRGGRERLTVPLGALAKCADLELVYISHLSLAGLAKPGVPLGPGCIVGSVSSIVDDSDRITLPSPTTTVCNAQHVNARFINTRCM